ncbi:MAG: leucine-rich repeat protein [Bacteroidales bacterium]|nr:leucine-rich repeat protein [Bacteroidales bacterium]
MFKKHLLLVMCLGTYVAAMADGGYIVSYTDQYSNENVATITWSESGTSTLQEAIKTVGEKTFTNGLKKVKIIGEVSDVAALSTINCPTIDLSEAVLPSVSTGTFTNGNVKYVVLPNGMAKSDVNTWAKSRFTNLESAASASYATETQSKWVYDNDVVYEGEVTNINGTTATGKINVDVPLTVVSSSYKNGDTEYTGTVLVGSDNKAYGITNEANLVNLTAATGYTYTDGSRKEYTGEVSEQEGGTLYGCLNPTSTHTLLLNKSISYTYDNGKYAYTGRAYDNGYNAKYILEGGKEVQLTKLENTTYYTYTEGNSTYIYEGPRVVTSDYNLIYGNVGGTQVDLSEKQGYTLWGGLYEGVVSIEGEKAYGIQNQNTFQLTSIPENSYWCNGTVDGIPVKYLCDASTAGAERVTDNQYYYLASDNSTQIVYEGKVYYAQADLETKSSPLGSTEYPRDLGTSNKYVYTIDGTEYTYTGKVYPENKGFVGGTEYQLTENKWTAYYYTEAGKKIVYKDNFISDDNYGCVGYTKTTQLIVSTPSIVVNYYEEDGKLVIYSGKVYGTNTAYVGGTEVTLDYGTYYKNGDSVYEGKRTADNTKGYTGGDEFLLTAAFTYSYTDPDTEEVLTFTSTDVLTTWTVKKTVVLTQKEVDIPTDKIILTAYVKTPGTLVYTLMHMSVFHNYNGGGWQNYDMSNNVWYGKSEGAYNYKVDNVRDLILSGNLNAVDMNTGGTCVTNDGHHYATSGEGLLSWNALPSCKPEKIDLSDALFGEGKNYHPEDMTISGYYAYKSGIKEIILPTAKSQNTIPADFMNKCEGVQSLCIPYNYEIIGERAFFNAHGLTHIYTTDPKNTAENPDNVKTDHGDGSFTFSANLKEIRSEGSDSKGTFFGNSMQVKVFDIYNLAVKAPKCGAYAFQGDLTFGNNGFAGNWTHPICRKNYINNGHVICMLHYPTESKTYTRPGGTCVEAANYEDITRVYTLADETGAVDGSGNTRAWPRHAEFNRSFKQAINGYTWEGWKLYLDETAEYKEVVSEYSADIVVDATKTYNQKDYQGWHEFVLTENNIFVPFDPQNRYENFVEKDWYTICVPYDIKKSELLMALGVKAGSNNKVRRLKKNADGTTGTELGTEETVNDDLYPDVRTLVQVKRSVNERKVTLCLSEPLVTATKCQDVLIPADRQGYEYTELTDPDPVVMKGGYPYLVRPFIPEDDRIKNIGAYVVSVASQNNFTRPTYPGGLGDTEKSAAGTTFSLPVKEGVETQALNKDQSTPDRQVYVTLDGSAPCMYNFVGTYLNGNVPQYGYYLGVSKSTGKHQFFRTTKTTTKWNQYSAIIKGFTKPEFTIPGGEDKTTIQNVRRTFTPDPADDLIILKSESPTLAGKAMTLILDDSGEDDNTTTAIRDIDMDRNMDNNNKVYTIGGMLTNGSNRLQKGIYIKNGKKHVVK